jgi:putative tricarboxylic transport membrane protein
MRINDAAFGLALLGGAGLIAWTASGFPEMPGQRFGPSLFPDLIATGFAICGALLVWNGLHSGEVHGIVEVPEWMRRHGEILDVVLVIGGLGLLILLWTIVGFLIGASIYVGVLISRFRRGRLASSWLVAIAACAMIDYGFRKWLLVPLPMGPLAGVMW